MRMTGFILSFENLMKKSGLSPDDLRGNAEIDAEKVRSIIKHLLRGVHVDEEWYRKTYDDVDAAIKNGSYESSKHHFVEVGYFEGRRPGPVRVNEAWYVETYPDVAEGIELGEIQSAQEHFDEHGYQEGRLPSAY
jgi:hypothetical protein